jgi:2-keto-4-pentenoate hydratase/2-oxohepta-3-ene-1,7-dioic acid hydratase in catechol pathway
MGVRFASFVHRGRPAFGVLAADGTRGRISRQRVRHDGRRVRGSGRADRFREAPPAVIGAGAPIVTANDPTGTVDYEGELGVVIGAAAFRVSASDAMRYVYGYTIVNDVTARELQSRHKQWFVGKSVDSFCPMGPYLVTADEVPTSSSIFRR